MDKEQKRKNIYDLEYNHLLNKQNILLGFIGALVIAVSFSSELPGDVSKLGLIFSLILFAFVILEYFSKQLEKITEKIREI